MIIKTAKLEIFKINVKLGTGMKKMGTNKRILRMGRYGKINSK